MRSKKLRVSPATTVAFAATVFLVLVSVFFAFDARRRSEIVNQRAAENFALAEQKRLDAYREEAEKLWPWPLERRAEVMAWLEKAEALLARLDQHSAELAGLRQNAFPAEDMSPIAADRQYRFSDPETEQRHEMVQILVEGLEAFQDPDPTKGIVAAVKHVLSIYPSKADFEKAWEEAIASIRNPRESPMYSKLGTIELIDDLFPIGRDPDSRLWEFVHLETGGVPERDEAERLEIADDTGLVLVLLPGGTFWMGAQATDKNARHYDPDVERAYRNRARSAPPEDRVGPVHEESLTSFFIAKFEVRQAVWGRVMEANPSLDWASSLPVHNLTPNDCREFCKRAGFSLPTEAQWEYACRAGTDGPHSGTSALDEIAWYRDNSGRKPHSVGEKKPNGFGLYDVHGNVWEWCEDDSVENHSKVGVTPGDPNRGVMRGGGFFSLAICSSSSHRFRPDRHRIIKDSGFRPVMPLPYDPSATRIPAVKRPTLTRLERVADDSFDGKTTLDWQIRRSDPSHVSLERKPGTLTITTQRGSFHRSGADYENVFLVENPLRDGGDFELTTCLVGFNPYADWQEAGVLCWNDHDNFVKGFSMWNSLHRGLIYNSSREVRASVREFARHPVSAHPPRLWLRMTKIGQRYTFSTSSDGESFEDWGTSDWARAPAWLGLYAQNGPGSKAPEIDASFDFFEVWTIESPSRSR